jgi:hypothetical protein
MPASDISPNFFTTAYSGLAQYEFGFVWLTPKGVEIAIQKLGLEREDMAA